MKKVVSLFLSVFMIFQMIVFSSAVVFQEDEHFKIDIPEDYTRIGEFDFIKDDDTFSISYQESERKKAIEDYKESDLVKEGEETAQKGKEALQSIGKEGYTELLGVDRYKHKNGMTVLVTKLKSAAVIEGEEMVNYSKTYEFNGAVNQYFFSFVTHDEAKLDDFDSVIDTVEINEEEAQSYKDKAIIYTVLALIVIVVIVGIVKFIKSAGTDRTGDKESKKEDNKDKNK